jgi:sodium transport system ATP-binding protein
VPDSSHPAAPRPRPVAGAGAEAGVVLRVDGLRKSYGANEVVRGLSFDIRRGECFGLLGPNGAGKTTTLRMLYSVMRPDSGTIEVDHVDATKYPRDAQARLGVLPDIVGLYPRLTAREQVRYYGELHGLDGQALEERTNELLKTLDLMHLADRRAAGYSHGERTKVAIARALVHRPQNVILDEPTNGLDVMATRAVREVFRALSKEGHCVVFSSHVMQEVSALCDRIVVIARGRVAADGTPDELRQLSGEQNLEDAFVALTGEKQEAV